MTQIDEGQLIHPLEWDEWSTGKVDALRRAYRAGTSLPPVYLLHYSKDSSSPYFHIEGRHRYNAAHLEQLEALQHGLACRLRLPGQLMGSWRTCDPTPAPMKD